MSQNNSRRCVLLVDMGGPRSLAEVKPYLRRIFSDPFIIPGNRVKRWLLSRAIARASAAETRERYASIGGKSNAVEDAQVLARQLTERFAARGIELQCAVATRYSKPDIPDGLAALAERDGQTVTPVFLFPHETSALTGSCVSVLGQASARLGISAEPGVRHLGITDAYVRGWAEAIKQAVQHPDETYVLFSVHSLPLSIVRRGDTYIREVQRSVGRIAALLGNLASGLAYQSQEGEAWLEPKAEDKAAEAYRAGFRELIVAPLSFVGDNTETLVDLDRDLRKAVEPLGFRRFVRLETPNKLGFLPNMVCEALCKEWGLEP